jgi:hypothetical protein
LPASEESAGGDADEPLEVPGELGLIAEADLDRDLGERELPRGDEPLGALDALVDHELVRRQAGRVLEQPREVELAQVKVSILANDLFRIT